MSWNYRDVLERIATALEAQVETDRAARERDEDIGEASQAALSEHLAFQRESLERSSQEARAHTERCEAVHRKLLAQAGIQEGDETVQ